MNVRIAAFAENAWPLAGVALLMVVGALVPALSHVLDLALPFFGLIALGFFCGRQFSLPEAGLQWLNIFIVYVALPSLFFSLIAATPVADLANGHFILATTATTATIFAVSLVVGLVATGGKIAESAIQGAAGAYSNVGYMGPGLTIAALGTAAVAPTALICVFDNVFLFSALPLLMALSGREKRSRRATLLLAAKRIFTHPFILAAVAGLSVAMTQATLPVTIGRMLGLLQNAAAPCALFAMGVTVALRPIKRVSLEMPVLLAIKLVVHPLLVWVVLSLAGDFGRVWTLTAVLMAALPPALNVFVMASQYQTYVERASAIILLGTLMSVLTITLLLYLITANVLPYRLFYG